MKTIFDIIDKWEETIAILDNLITLSNPDNDMLCIMMARKNQLIECVKDFKDVLKEQAPKSKR